MLSEYLPQSLTLTEIVLRIAAAACAGLILGLDRDIKGKPVDFRAYMIICMATAMMAMITQELLIIMPQNAENLNLDPYRIIEGVLVGIGF
ncbi:MAG: MgtC/SapB family protein, partial [Alphaproteobacteria bacterium]